MLDSRVRPYIRLFLVSLVVAMPLAAQEARTGIVQVTVEEPMGMVTGFTIRSAGRSAVTDARGNARLTLPVGNQSLSVTGIGYKPTQISVTVVADSVVTVRIPVEMAGTVMEGVKVSATRIERLAGESPTRVEVLDEMEVDENTLMAPSGISMLLNETPGLRVQQASPGLGTGSVRILGLPGQYTVMLADGLPLYGGASSALGLLDVSPVDLQRVEIIKGAASSLYGGQALGGVINLVSKPPTGKSEVLLNRRTNVAARFTVSGNRRRREFGPGRIERDGGTTGFLEVTRSAVASGTAMVLGSAVQLDAFENSLNSLYDHSWFTPSLFATAERAVGPVTVSASARGDAHPEVGTQLTERVAALVKPAEGWSVRLSAGTGFAAPTAITEETEAVGLRAIRPGPELRGERGYGSMLDVNGRLAGAEVLVTAYGSVITDAIHLADAGDGSGDGILRNASGNTRMTGVVSAAIWRFEGGKFLGTYGYMKGSRPDAMTGAREPLPMVPRHRVGGDLMFEREGVFRGGIEGIWYGAQSLDDNPYRSRSKPYLYLMAIAVRQFGRPEAVANFENLLNVRQTDTDPLVRPTPGTGGRWTTDVWAPLEGFMANVAVRYRW